MMVHTKPNLVTLTVTTLTAMAKDSATAKDAMVTTIEGAETCHGKPTLSIYDLPGSLEDILDGYSTLSNSEALFISLLA